VLVRHLRTFRSLSNPGFRFYFANSLVSQASVNMLGMARALLVYRLTGSAALLGIASVINFAPVIFLAPLGGVLADRLKKKHVVLMGQLSSVLMALLMAVPLSMGYLQADNHASWWVLLASYVLDGMAIGLTGPSYQAIVREIVTAEEVMNAVALNSLAMNVLRMLAPLAAGFLINELGFAAVFYIVAGLFLAGNVFIALIPSSALLPTGPVGQRRSWAEIRRGFAYVRGQPALSILLVFLFVSMLLSMPYGSLMPIFADDVLNVGATGMGILVSVSGIGATISSLVLASMPNRRRGIILLSGTLLLGLTLTAFSFSRSWAASLVLIFFVGSGEGVRMTVGNALLLYYAEREYWGRVMSLQSMCFGLSSLGVVAAALLAGRIGAPWAVGGMAFVLVFLTLLAIAFVPRFRRLE
jgi:MFS family permease